MIHHYTTSLIMWGFYKESEYEQYVWGLKTRPLKRHEPSTHPVKYKFSNHILQTSSRNYKHIKKHAPKNINHGWSSVCLLSGKQYHACVICLYIKGQTTCSNNMQGLCSTADFNTFSDTYTVVDSMSCTNPSFTNLGLRSRWSPGQWAHLLLLRVGVIAACNPPSGLASVPFSLSLFWGTTLKSLNHRLPSN